MPSHRASILLVVAALLVLAGCGGGSGSPGGGDNGGGDNGGGDTPPTVPAYSEPRPSRTVTASLTLEVSGLEGVMEVQDAKGRSLFIGSAGSHWLGDYAAGETPGLRIAAVSDGQICQIGVDRFFAMPAYSTVVPVDCALALWDGGVGAYYPLQVAVLTPLVSPPMEGTLTGRLNDSANIELAVEAGRVLFVVPELAPGPHRVSFTLAGRSLTYAFDVLEAPALPDPGGYLASYRDSLLAALASYRDTLAAEQQAAAAELQQELEGAFQQLEALSPDALETVARFLRANQPPEPAVLKAGSGVWMSMAARSGYPLLAAAAGGDSDVRRCMGALGQMNLAQLKLVRGLAAGGLGGVAGYLLASAVGATAATPAVLVLGAGAFIGIAVSKEFATSLRLALKICVNDSIDMVVHPPSTAWQSVGSRSMVHLSAEVRTATSSSPNAESSAAGDLLLHHEQARTADLRIRRELHPFAQAAVRKLRVLAETVPLPQGLVDAVREVEFEQVLPLDAGSAGIAEFHSPGAPIVTAFTHQGSTAEFKFAFADVVPPEAQAFSLQLLATIDGEPVSLPLRGALAAGRPLAYDTTEAVSVDEVLEGTILMADFAEHFELIEPPAHGQLALLDPESGEFRYTPASGFEGEDGFRFVAHNAAGSSEPAQVTITVRPFCSVHMPDAGTAIRTCDYPHPEQKNRIVIVTEEHVREGELDRRITFHVENRPFSDDPEATEVVYARWFTTVRTESATGYGQMKTARSWAVVEPAEPPGPWNVNNTYGAHGYQETWYEGILLTTRGRTFGTEGPTARAGVAGGQVTERSCTWRTGEWTQPFGGYLRQEFHVSSFVDVTLSAIEIGPSSCPTEAEIDAIHPLDVRPHFRAPFSQLYRLMRTL